MQESKRDKPTFVKRSVSLRTDQWVELERVADEEAKHGMVSRTLQDVVDAWTTFRERTEQMAEAAR
jgi:hypothetical protein